MDLSEFEANLDRYGGDLSAWPQPLRLDAIKLMADSAPARAAAQAMADVEAVLGATTVVVGNDANTIAARAMRHPQVGAHRVALRRTGWAAVAAAALVVGVFVGDTFTRHHDNTETVMAAAFGATDAADVD